MYIGVLVFGVIEILVTISNTATLHASHHVRDESTFQYFTLVAHNMYNHNISYYIFHIYYIDKLM